MSTKISRLVKKTDYDTKISEIEKKITDHNHNNNYITTQFFNKLTEHSIDNDVARNVVIFGVDNVSLSHADNRKNKFLMFGEGPAYGFNGSFCSAEKNFSIDFSKAKTNFCLSLHYKADSY